jgi:uncharacterized protein YbcV (DUF1398 family)
MEEHPCRLKPKEKERIPMNTKIAKECSKLSEEEKITFPEVIAFLDQAGIESYVTNILVPSKIYYAENEAYETPLNYKVKLEVAHFFNQKDIEEAVFSIQANKITYQEFLKKIAESGVIFYIVFIKGKKVIYFGRKGEQHVESWTN